MLKDTIKTLILFTTFIICGNIVAWLKVTFLDLPSYLLCLNVIGLLGYLWIYVIKLMKSMGE